MAQGGVSQKQCTMVSNHAKKQRYTTSELRLQATQINLETWNFCLLFHKKEHPGIPLHQFNSLVEGQKGVKPGKIDDFCTKRSEFFYTTTYPK